MKKRVLYTSLLLNGLFAGSVAAQEATPQAIQMANLNTGYVPQIERSLMEIAEAGDSNAQLALARIYESRNDDNSKGLIVEWYKKSAESGNAEAQFQLGLMYIDGEMPDGDREMGMFWVEQAASQGHHRAKVVFDSLEEEEFTIGC